MNIIRIYTAILFYCIFNSIIFSQSLQIPDSLLRQMNSPVQKEKFQGYVDLIKYFNKTMPEKAFSYGENALQIARENNFPSGEADILFALGITHLNVGNYNKAMDCFHKAYEIRNRLNDREGVGEVMTRIALVQVFQGKYEECLKSSYKSISLLEHSKNNRILGEAYNILGLIYYVLKDIKKAEEFALKSLKLTESLADKSVPAYSHEALGIIYMNTGDYKKALYHTKEVLRFREELNDRIGLAGCFTNLAMIYRDLKDYSSAIQYYQKSLAIKKELNDKQGMGASYTGIGVAYINMGNTKQGLENLIKAYEIRKEINDKRGIVSTLRRVSNAYSQLGDYKTALDYHKLLMDYKDSLINEQTNKSIAELKEQFQSERNEKEILLLQRENTIQKNLRNYLLIISLLITVIAVSTFIAYRSKKKMNNVLNLHNQEVTSKKEELQKLNEELKKLNDDKDTFFTIIAHDLKSPFSSLLGYSEFLAKDISNLSNEEIRSFSEEIFNSAHKVFKLLENLLWWARLNTGRIEHSPKNFNLMEVVLEVINLYKENIVKKKINLKCSHNSSSAVFADMNMIHTVIRNLMSNAIKFTHPGGNIFVNITKNNNSVQFSIEDNGTGIEENLLEKLFTERNKTSNKGTAKEAGTGLGLFLCKEFIKINNGSIWAESKLNSGSTFYFTLPVENPIIIKNSAPAELN